MAAMAAMAEKVAVECVGVDLHFFLFAALLAVGHCGTVAPRTLPWFPFFFFSSPRVCFAQAVDKE